MINGFVRHLLRESAGQPVPSNPHKGIDGGTLPSLVCQRGSFVIVTI